MTEAWEPPRLSGGAWRVGKAGPEVRWRKESQAEVKRDRSHRPALGRKEERYVVSRTPIRVALLHSTPGTTF